MAIVLSSQKADFINIFELFVDIIFANLKATDLVVIKSNLTLNKIA